MSKSNLLRFPLERINYTEEQLRLYGSERGLILTVGKPSKGYTYDPVRLQNMIDFIKLANEKVKKTNAE